MIIALPVQREGFTQNQCLSIQILEKKQMSKNLIDENSARKLIDFVLLEETVLFC